VAHAFPVMGICGVIGMEEGGIRKPEHLGRFIEVVIEAGFPDIGYSDVVERIGAYDQESGDYPSWRGVFAPTGEYLEAEIGNTLEK